jgi:hypothetical protein
MNLTITRAHALTQRLVEVEATGPRGGEYHFALYYDRGFEPEPRLVIETDALERTAVHNPGNMADVPQSVLKAALRARNDLDNLSYKSAA